MLLFNHNRKSDCQGEINYAIQQDQRKWAWFMTEKDNFIQKSKAFLFYGTVFR